MAAEFPQNIASYQSRISCTSICAAYPHIPSRIWLLIEFMSRINRKWAILAIIDHKGAGYHFPYQDYHQSKYLRSMCRLWSSVCMLTSLISIFVYNKISDSGTKAPSQYKDNLSQVWGLMGSPILVRRYIYIETSFNSLSIWGVQIIHSMKHCSQQ